MKRKGTFLETAAFGLHRNYPILTTTLKNNSKVLSLFEEITSVLQGHSEILFQRE